MLRADDAKAPHVGVLYFQPLRVAVADFLNLGASKPVTLPDVRIIDAWFPEQHLNVNRRRASIVNQ